MNEFKLIIRQLNQGKNEFSTIYSVLFHRTLTTAVQSVVEPCNTAVYLYRVISLYI